ncbi:MAG: hypothetical protein OXC45_01355 [Gemmatimonadetes bacterium]|nr:hypothetical protein [Gemmatimonadota bacterium]
MISRNKSDTRPLHETLLDDLEQMLAIYDQSVQLMLEAVRHDGYFDEFDPDALVWPKSESGTMDMEALQFRAQLVDAIFRDLPEVRNERLDEAYRPFSELLPLYHTGSRIYLQLRRQFVARGRGDAKDFLKLYQSLYLKALAQAELHAPEAVEEALAQVHITQVPMSHARAVAEALDNVEADEDAHWAEEYSCERDGERIEGSLRDLLQDVAQRTLNLIAAGGLLSTRYNYLTNFGWFGVSVWKVIVDAEVALARLRDDVDLDGIDDDVLHIKALLIEFLHAHQEEPTRLRPRLYWYGQEYSYLTRDMIDLSVKLICDVNAQIDRVGQSISRMEIPALLADTARGRFLEYPDVGRRGQFSKLQRGMRFARWMGTSLKIGRQKKKLLEKEADPILRREAGWRTWLDWGRRTLEIFDIRVDVYIDPHFEAIVRDLGADAEGRRLIFLPTHQSLFDHPVLYKVLQSQEFMNAMGWERPEPCVILARTGLARSGIKIGSKQITQFGMTSEVFDQILENVDGYVMLERSRAAGHTTQRVAQALTERPGVIYPMATTAAFAVQQFPLQHGVFAQLPQDVVIVPIAYRGLHALWPKCPKGNININPGQVDVWVSPPMLGETTLLPKRRSLRIQSEAAALFQAVHIATLLNPEES